METDSKPKLPKAVIVELANQIRISALESGQKMPYAAARRHARRQIIAEIAVYDASGGASPELQP